MLFTKATIMFKNGFNVILGETGSGKSFLIDCLNIVLGERSKAEMIRSGNDYGVIIAQFDIAKSPQVKNFLIANHIQTDDNLLTIKKVINRSSTNRAYINDMPVSNNLITKLGEMIVEIHGQFSHHISAANYQALLDNYLGLQDKVKEVAALYQNLNDLQNNYNELITRQAKIGEEREYLDKMIKDISTLNLTSDNEELTLIEKRNGYNNLAHVSSTISQLLSCCNEDRILSPLNQIQKSLFKLNEALNTEPFNGMIATCTNHFEQAISEIREGIAIIEELDKAQNFDEKEFESLEDRIHQIRIISRKYATESINLLTILQEAKDQIKVLDNLASTIEEASGKLSLAKKDYLKEAQALSALRHNGLKGFEDALMNELSDLKLAAARFKVHIVTSEEIITSTGIDKIEFLASMNPGIELNALHKIASGGELSRFMLAFRIVTASKTNIPTLILDEIDTGTSGIVAAAIGNKMVKLGQETQILVITHNHQIAIRADHFYKIEKHIINDNTSVTIDTLNYEQVAHEIATLLSGKVPLEEDLTVARNLLKQKQDNNLFEGPKKNE